MMLSVVGVAAVGTGVICAYNYFKTPAPRPAPATEEISSLPEMIRNAQRVLGMDCNIYYNIGICGGSGAGKSSFINCMRKIRDVRITRNFQFREDGPAPIGIDETTSECTRYCYPENEAPYLRLWDMPGGNTTRHPAKTYFYDKLLYAFDCLLILHSGRFTELDLEICKKAYEYRIPVLLVRSKADIDVNNQKRMKQEELDRQLTPDEYDQVVRETINILKRDTIRGLTEMPGCEHLMNLLVYVVAPQSYRSPQLNECPPLEMEDMLGRCLTVAAMRRR